MKTDELKHSPLHGAHDPTDLAVHDPEKDMTILARWLYRAMQNRQQFWLGLGMVVVLPLVAVVIFNALSLGSSPGQDAWTELMLSKGTADDLKSLGEKFAGQPAAGWADYQAADQYFSQGVSDLPGNKDASTKSFENAIKLFQQAAAAAPSGSDLSRFAQFGEARVLETRNRLKEAIAKYEAVAKAWPESLEGKKSSEMVRLLALPESQKFYDELYALKLEQPTIPPGGTVLPPGGSFPIDLPPLGGGGSPISPTAETPVPPLSIPAGEMPKPATAPTPATAPSPVPIPGLDLPSLKKVDRPKAAPMPNLESPKSEAGKPVVEPPKASSSSSPPPTPGVKSELPENPFSEPSSGPGSNQP